MSPLARSSPTAAFDAALSALPAPVDDPRRRRLLRLEVVVVLSTTFGLSGLHAILDLTRSLLAERALRDQTTTLNRSQAAQQWLDAAYQFAHVLQLVAWAVLPLLLLAHSGIAPRVLGLVRDRLGRQTVQGLGLAALIGIPGLAVYFTSVALGVNLQVAPSGLTESWWRPVALVASAAANGAAEEILVVGYLLVRLRQLGWSPVAMIAASALLRGSYHLYQGFGGGLGNLAMGVVFALWFLRTRRVVPLVVAHTTLDVVAFLGYALLAPHVDWL